MSRTSLAASARVISGGAFPWSGCAAVARLAVRPGDDAAVRREGLTEALRVRGEYDLAAAWRRLGVVAEVERDDVLPPSVSKHVRLAVEELKLGPETPAQADELAGRRTATKDTRW
jgi:hypothetical protein